MDPKLPHQLVDELQRARLFVVNAEADPGYLALARSTLLRLAEADPRLASLKGAVQQGADLVEATTQAIERLTEQTPG